MIGLVFVRGKISRYKSVTTSSRRLFFPLLTRFAHAREKWHASFLNGSAEPAIPNPLRFLGQHRRSPPSTPRGIKRSLRDKQIWKSSSCSAMDSVTNATDGQTGSKHGIIVPIWGKYSRSIRLRIRSNQVQGITEIRPAILLRIWIVVDSVNLIFKLG